MEGEKTEAAAEPVEPITEELRGVFVAARVFVQCFECGNLIDGPERNGVDVVNADPSVEGIDRFDELEVECPTCTASSGRRSVIPLVILVGEQVEMMLPPGEEPPEPAEKKPEAPPASSGTSSGG